MKLRSHPLNFKPRSTFSKQAICNLLARFSHSKSPYPRPSISPSKRAVGASQMLSHPFTYQNTRGLPRVQLIKSRDRSLARAGRKHSRRPRVISIAFRPPAANDSIRLGAPSPCPFDMRDTRKAHKYASSRAVPHKSVVEQIKFKGPPRSP